MEAMLSKALGQDVSKLPASERQRLLSRLLARLAHEIRNPLSSLDIHVQLLEEDLSLTAPEVRHQLSNRLEIIRGELHRLENIVSQFLRLAGPSAVEAGPVNIGEVVARVRAVLEPELQKRSIVLVPVVAPDLPTMQADAGQLTQALLNLAINAIQAIERDGRIEIRVVNEERSITVEVRDTGPGVPGDKLSTVFEPYYTTKPEGTGLGLWIAQQIAVAHGGQIYAQNVPGGGTLFALQLPINISSPA